MFLQSFLMIKFPESVLLHRIVWHMLLFGLLVTFMWFFGIISTKKKQTGHSTVLLLLTGHFLHGSDLKVHFAPLFSQPNWPSLRYVNCIRPLIPSSNYLSTSHSLLHLLILCFLFLFLSLSFPHLHILWTFYLLLDFIHIFVFKTPFTPVNLNHTTQIFWSFVENWRIRSKISFYEKNKKIFAEPNCSWKNVSTLP